ncbi:oligosaccharide flippase family protein [Mycobacterium sp. AZCC_0083]|uniref:lipopolysaccharide biosynthesis protein n=1 Tax=Mycobacterium sp. AZCC_0083 TaxID=2735882 RepID=UPI002814B5A1|nr:oligosaccharide flippase family protein [Mycobacterium sp. AZCC_0083]
MAGFRSLGSAVLRSRDARMSLELGLATALGPFAGFIANVIYARTLGASGRGDLAAAVAALSVCEAALTLGLPDILARHVAKGSMPPGAQRTLAGVAVAVSIIPGALVAIYCHSWHFSWPVAIAAGLVVPFTTATMIARGVLLGQHAYRKLTASQVVGGVFRLVAPLTLLLVERPTENLGLVVILGYYVAAAVPIYACRPYAGRAAGFRKVLPILREALIVWPAYAAWPLYANLDQLVLAAMVSPADLGRYAVCVAIAQAPAALASGPRQVLLARAAKSQSLDEIPKIAQAILVIAVVSGTAFGYFAGPLLAAVFGPEFQGISFVLGILLAATGFEIGLGMLNTGLVAVGRVRSATVNQSIALLITAVVLPIAVSLGGGILAAAVVRLVAAASACLMSRLGVQRFSRSQQVDSEQL